jgi:hypothetical protein
MVLGKRWRDEATKRFWLVGGFPVADIGGLSFFAAAASAVLGVTKDANGMQSMTAL